MNSPLPDGMPDNWCRSRNPDGRFTISRIRSKNVDLGAGLVLESPDGSTVMTNQVSDFSGLDENDALDFWQVTQVLNS